MIDRTPPPVGAAAGNVTLEDEATPDPAGRRTRRRPSAARARIAVAGIGFTAMLALVGNMEFSEGRTQSADPALSSAVASPRTIVVVHQGAAPASIKAAAGGPSRPIVLTAHAVVRTVKAPATGGSGGYVAASATGGSAYATAGGGSAPAAAPAAAPVASTGGSH
jgi:hypothetical protein